MIIRYLTRALECCGFVMALLASAALARGQGRIAQLPGYEQYQRVNPQINSSVRLAELTVNWSGDGRGFDYQWDGHGYHFDLASLKAAQTGATTPASRPGAGGGRGGRGGQAGGPARGRQAASETSPDGRLKAFYRDRNLWLSDAAGNDETAITTAGDEKKRTKFGTASWVYGEELGQRTAIWWSPDSAKVAYYGFDESKVRTITCRCARRR